MKTPIPRRHPYVRVKERFGRSIVVMPETAFLLGGSGAEILALCDGQRSEAEIAAEIVALDPEARQSADSVEDERVLSEVSRFLERMRSLGVLESERAEPGADA